MWKFYVFLRKFRGSRRSRSVLFDFVVWYLYLFVLSCNFRWYQDNCSIMCSFQIKTGEGGSYGSQSPSSLGLNLINTIQVWTLQINAHPYVVSVTSLCKEKKNETHTRMHIAHAHANNVVASDSELVRPNSVTCVNQLYTCSDCSVYTNVNFMYDNFFWINVY